MYEDEEATAEMSRCNSWLSVHRRLSPPSSLFFYISHHRTPPLPPPSSPPAHTADLSSAPTQSAQRRKTLSGSSSSSSSSDTRAKMLLGKRPRPPMRRTTSLTEFTLDLGPVEGSQSSDQGKSRDGQKASAAAAANGSDHGGRRYPGAAPPEGGFDPRLLAVVSPRIHRRNSGDFLEPAHFLRACGLCKRRLGPGRDIYMYRGDTAFCSLECRQQQMNQDERKEKCSFSSVKKEASQATGSEASNKGETVAAA